MKEFKTKNNEDFEVVSCSDRCKNVYSNVKLLITKLKQINISCRHPKGPGNPVHCIYFKSRDRT